MKCPLRVLRHGTLTDLWFIVAQVGDNYNDPAPDGKDGHIDIVASSSGSQPIGWFVIVLHAVYNYLRQVKLLGSSEAEPCAS